MSFHSQIFNTVGSPTFTVPTYGVLVVLVGGPGQGGTGSDVPIDPPPGNSRHISLALEKWLGEYPDRPSLFVGSPPTADTTFNTGGGQVKGTGYGRGAPTGGTYNTTGSGAVGGSSSGTVTGNPGNLAVKIYFPGDLTVGANIPISIPAGGAGEVGTAVSGTAGGNGFVQCYWTDLGSNQVFSASGTFNTPNYSTLTVFEFGSGGGGKGTDAGTGFQHDGLAAGNSSFNTSVIAQGGAGTDTQTPGGGSGGDASITGAGATGGGGLNSGGFTYKTYAPGALTGNINVTIANGGLGGAGTATPGVVGTKGQAIVSYISLAKPMSQAFVIG